MALATRSVELVARAVHGGRIPLEDAGDWLARFERKPAETQRDLTALAPRPTLASDNFLAHDRAMAGEAGVLLLLARLWT